MFKFSINPALEGVNSNRRDRHVTPNICVDLDGTLATFDKFVSWDHIGEPIQATVDRIKQWRDLGIEVRILTARMSEEARALDGITREQMEGVIKAWCKKHLGFELPVYSEKGPGLLFLLDDSVVQVERNTGRYIAGNGIKQFDAEIDAAVKDSNIDISTFQEVDQTSLGGEVQLSAQCMIPPRCQKAFIHGLKAAGLNKSCTLEVNKNEQTIQFAFTAESDKKPVKACVNLYTRVYSNDGVESKYCVAQINAVSGSSSTYVNLNGLDYLKFGKYIGEKIMA